MTGINKEILHQLFHGTVVQKLNGARKLMRQYESRLRGDETLGADFELLNEYALELNRHMVQMRMGESCVRCAGEKGGGCCSLFMAGETDSVQMLMNMLAGVVVTQVRNDGIECRFLGENGCLFLFKPMFCLNYNCRNIHDTVEPEDLRELERLSGRLLGKQYEVEKRILSLIVVGLSSRIHEKP